MTDPEPNIEDLPKIKGKKAAKVEAKALSTRKKEKAQSPDENKEVETTDKKIRKRAKTGSKKN